MRILLIASLISTISFAGEPLQSKKLKSEICSDLATEYAENDEYSYETDLSKLGIEIKKSDCLKMEAVVEKVIKKKLGSKEYVVGLDLKLTNPEYMCAVNASRSLSLTLDANDKPVITISEWSFGEKYSQLCYINASREIRFFDWDEDSEKLVKLTDQNTIRKLYSPDYLELGEPDDGTVGVVEKNFVYKKGNTVFGYVKEYYYANSEGEWATLYILKYNAQGKLLGNLIEDYGWDYCEYPGFEETPRYCENN